MRKIKDYDPPVIGIKKGIFVTQGGKGVKTFAFNKRTLDTVRNTIMTIRYKEMLSRVDIHIDWDKI